MLLVDRMGGKGGIGTDTAVKCLPDNRLEDTARIICVEKHCLSREDCLLEPPQKLIIATTG